MDLKDHESAGNHTTRVVDGKAVLLDEEGYFVHPESWTETIAKTIALEMGISELTDRQWEMIYFLRTFYLTNGRAPLNRDIKRQTGMNLIEVEQLFPEGIRRGARRLAGLPNPKSC